MASRAYLTTVPSEHLPGVTKENPRKTSLRMVQGSSFLFLLVVEKKSSFILL